MAETLAQVGCQSGEAAGSCPQYFKNERVGWKVEMKKGAPPSSPLCIHICRACFFSSPSFSWAFGLFCLFLVLSSFFFISSFSLSFPSHYQPGKLMRHELSILSLSLPLSLSLYIYIYRVSSILCYEVEFFLILLLLLLWRSGWMMWSMESMVQWNVWIVRWDKMR